MRAAFFASQLAQSVIVRSSAGLELRAPRSNPHGVGFPVAMAIATTSCFALIATCQRWELLTRRSLPSIALQKRPPDLVVLVNDAGRFDQAQEEELRRIVSPIPLEMLTNHRAHGVAGAWNSGLDYLEQCGLTGFVAILDDDDSWDPTHLSENLAVASQGSTSIVVSGLRRIVSGIEMPRMLPEALTDRVFLVSNPGWQGSNTFVALALLKRAGRFREGLQSLNDRDLAIRLLRSPGASIGYTNQWTSSWHVDPAVTSLSTPRSPAKFSGLRLFWRVYGAEMTTSERALFFDRALRMFGVSGDEIVEAANLLQPPVHIPKARPCS
jgi:hypothetical protein